MTGFGTEVFTDPDGLLAGLAPVTSRLVVTHGGAFSARLSWIAMNRQRLVVVEETTPRIALLLAPPKQMLVCVALGADSSLVWNGLPLRRGDLVLQASGERFCQRTTGPTQWGLISSSPAGLAAQGRALLGIELPLAASQLLRPPAGSARGLPRLLGRAVRLLRRDPELLRRREVARAFEQELVHALVSALGAATPDGRADAMRGRTATVLQFENALAATAERRSLPMLSAMLGVPQRTLRSHCADVLGCSPLEYARLRSLNLARSALLKADRRTSGVAEIARSFGFSQPGRFAVAYRELFGEAPLATLLHPFGRSAESA